jgi:flagellar basal-body rod protein FlgB
MIDDYLGTHANAIRLRSQRTKLLASNIANADTPNYKARDMAFAEVLRDVGGAPQFAPKKLSLSRSQGSSSGMNMTNDRHINGRQSVSTAAPLMYRQPQEASLDGNTVDKDMEQARFAENTIRYQASLEFIKSRVSGLVRALRSE